MYDDALLASALPVFAPSNIVTSNNGAAAATANWNAITAAIVACALAGGGTVQVPPAPPGQNIPISAPLTPLSGVAIKGVAPQLVYNTIPDSGLTTMSGAGGGTIFAPTGNFASFSWNTAALPAPASQTAFSQLGLTNVRFENLGFLGGSHGILAGGTNNPSCWYSQFVNLYFSGQTVGGEFLTNYQHCQFTGRYFFGLPWAALHTIDVAAASLAPGNSTYYDTYVCNPPGSGINALLARNITFLTTATTGGAANNNEFKFDRMQSNRFGFTTITQAATMANASANIGVTDGTKFAVDLPVYFDAAQNGFALGQIYFVVSVAANVIQVANTIRGTPVAATGSTAVNVVHTGFPCFEMIALAGSSNTNVVMSNTDCEGGATCAMVFQNVTSLILNASQWPGTAQSRISICGRSLINATIFSPADASTDFDGNASNRNIQFYGRRSANPSVQYRGAGMWYDTVSQKTVFSLGSTFTTESAGDLTFDPTTAGGITLAQTIGIGPLIGKQLTGATSTISTLNCVYSENTAAAVITLPACIAANKTAILGIVNSSAGSVTVNTAGELVNMIAGRNTFTINAGGSIYLQIMNTNSGSAYTWWIIGGSSAMAAGVISAPS